MSILHFTGNSNGWDNSHILYDLLLYEGIDLTCLAHYM